MNLQLNAGIQNIFNAYQDDFDKGADRDSWRYLWSVTSEKLLCRGEDQLLRFG